MLTGEDLPQVSNLYTCTQTQEADSYYLYAFWCTFRTFNMFWRFKYLWVIQKVPFQAVNEEILETPNHVCFQPLVNNFHPTPFTEKHEHCNLSFIQSRLWTLKKKKNPLPYQEFCLLFSQDQHQSSKALRTRLQCRNSATFWWDVPPSEFLEDSQTWICQNPLHYISFSIHWKKKIETLKYITSAF